MGKEQVPISIIYCWFTALEKRKKQTNKKPWDPRAWMFRPLSEFNSWEPHMIEGMLLVFTFQTVLPLKKKKKQKNLSAAKYLFYQLHIIHKISCQVSMNSSEAVHEKA